jgi:tetratricopeptide (TPR) repeat protein
VDELERSGDAAVVPAARRAWALDPAEEAGARRLLVLLDAKIGKAAALRAYDELIEHMRRELDSDPSPETRALAAHLKARSEPRAEVVTAALSAAAPPPNVSASAESSAPTATNAVINDVLSVPARRAPRTAAFAGGVLLIAALSLLALRPGRPMARLLPESPAQRAEHEGALRLAPKYRQDTSAYAAYLRGLTLRLNGEHTASRDTFAALVARNPLYAPGYAGLAHAYLIAVVNGVTPSSEGYAKADAAALRAIALDSTVASAYLALGVTEIAWRWDIRGAGALLNRGLALDPHDPEAHILRGNWFKWQGKADSAVAEYRKSYAVDPLSSALRARVARALLLARHTAEAEAMYRQSIEEYPRQADSYFGLSDVYLFTARPRDALNALRTGWAVAGDTGALARVPPAKSDTQALRVFDDEARQSLRDLEKGASAGEWVPADAFADTYAALRDTSETLLWLDSMVARHDPELCCVRLLPQFDFLRNNPRYRAWEARLPWVVDGAKASDSTR